MCAYCTVQDMENILPENIQIGRQNIGTPVPGRPGQGSSRSDISPSQAQYYINYASEYIDSRLRPYYLCPLRRVKTFETPIRSDVSSGSDVSVSVSDSASFIEHGTVRVQSSSIMETATISSVPDATTVILNGLSNDYSVDDGSLISVLEFPDPITIMATRFAVAFVLDRLFVGQQSPDVSEYGKAQRNMAKDSMDDILTGEILLFGQEHTGRRFARGSLFDAFKSPADVEKGQERE